MSIWDDAPAAFGAFDTKLSDEDEVHFQSWLTEQSAQLGRDLRNDLPDYDVRAQFQQMKAAGDLNIKPGHGSDIGKKPNHPTFSDESKHSTPEHPGGHWRDQGNDDWSYVPSPQMMAEPEHSPEEMAAYFKEAEPTTPIQSPPVDEWALQKARDRRSAADDFARLYDFTNSRNIPRGNK